MVKTKKQVDLLTQLVLSEDAKERAELADNLRKMLNKAPDPKTDIRSVLRELGTPTNILGYVSLGNFFLGYRAMIRSGDGKPVEILIEHWNDQVWEEVGRYRPKFCPNCGRELVENQQFKPLDPCGFRSFYSPELVHMTKEGI